MAAAAEQPLKKRKLYDPPPPSSPPPKKPTPPPQEPPPQPPQPSTPPPLSQEEILRRRRCHEEIRNVFECYKRIKLCIDKKGERFKPEMEEAYLSLIAASGGNASAKRLTAEYIPRYASYCPTALEVAASTVLNIHDWCFTVISGGEDIDGLAFETAKTCILGLVDICQAAASEAPTPAVIQGICSAVFLNVFSFFISSFEGNGILDIVDQRVLKIYKVSESFVHFSHEFLEEDNTALLKLSKFRALSFLRIFFSCPKNSLCAGFDLFELKGMEGIQKGNYFLRQLTNEVHDFGALDSTLKNCLLGMVLSKDPSFKSLIFSRYRLLCDSASSEVASDVTSVLEGVFESFVQKVKAEDSQLDSLDGNSSSSRARTPRELLNRQSFSPRARTPRDFRSNSFNARNLSAQVERSPVPNTDLPSPALRSSTGAANSPFDSPRQIMHPPPSSANVIWYSDGDQAAMDIYLASKQLWVESLGPDATEMLIRYQFEKFGFIEHLRFVPLKGFATIEYRNIMDALKAREVMRGHSPWGGPCLRIKFLDSGLGTRGAINGTAVGLSCHIYVGNVPSVWAKDEVMHEVKKVLHKGPRMVFDLGSEGALLMEFDSPEEAAMMIGHLRWHRRENSSFFRPPSNNSLIGSPHSQNMMLEKPPESYVTRTSSGLSSSLLQLRAKYNISHPQGPLESHSTGSSMRKQERTNTLWINVPNKTASCITDDEVLNVCNLAVINAGSIVRLSRTSMPTASYWLVECSSADTANTLLKYLRDSPGNFFQIEFSNPAMHHHASAPLLRPDSSTLELNSPRMSQGNSGPMMQPPRAYHSTWAGGGTVATEQSWMYGKPECGMRPGANIASIHGQTPGPFTPPHPIQSPPFIRPGYAPPNRWDPRGMSHHHPHANQIQPSAMTTNSHANLQALPFLPASVTPLAQMQGNSMAAPFDQMLSRSGPSPPILSLPPPPPNIAPPLPPSPPPPSPHVQPPAFPPPPPSSPPPPPLSAPSDTESFRTSQQQYPWQGILSKSGVHYCTIHAQRVDSDICNYSTAIAEPAEWPAKLDMMKRTDLRHVKSTFSSTPSHRREICWLVPSSHGDHKGFNDFLSYLKQRDCAGVIKIPAAANVMWARLLFILPYSPETCSMLSISPNPLLCLIGLVVPKETNSELT